jgi:formylglycine-generating enzyme required for sulfatase activity
MPVGSFAGNSFGLHDTVGNVSEWTCSEYSNSYDGSESQCSSIKGGARVIRGGSWYSYGGDVRSASRQRYDPVDRYEGIGFRLARDQTGSQSEAEPEAKQ